MAFRRPDTLVAAGGAGADDERARVTVLSPSVREPVPLSLHHLPLAVSFAVFQVQCLIRSPICCACAPPCYAGEFVHVCKNGAPQPAPPVTGNFLRAL